ncbi:hypothetical protein TYRP_006478 [Tyrophagus putrescentiae]|nr:hypothetical protein TYRP_006478 [Tyrophagus putrescentiae]
MYHHQTVVVVSPFKESSFKSPLLFKTKKYAIVAISVLTLAVWLFVRPTEVVLLVMDMHWQYARRYRAFLDIFLNLIVITVSAVHSTTGLLATVLCKHQHYFYARLHLDFCLALEALWLLSVHCSLANVLPLLGNTAWTVLVLLYVRDLKAIQGGSNGKAEDLQYFFL